MATVYIYVKDHNLGVAHFSRSAIANTRPPSNINIEGTSFKFVSIESMGATSNERIQKDVGNTIARGVLGGILMGPLGAIGGLMLGRNEVVGTTEFFFKVNLADGKYFIFSHSSPVTPFHSLTPYLADPVATTMSYINSPAAVCNEGGTGIDKSKRIPKAVVQAYRIKPTTDSSYRADIINKIKKYEVHTVNRQLVDHMYDLANYLIDGEYCERNTAKAGQILTEAIELAKTVVKKDREKFIKKCESKLYQL